MIGRPSPNGARTPLVNPAPFGIDGNVSQSFDGVLSPCFSQHSDSQGSTGSCSLANRSSPTSSK
jgi:hypothetical protein